MLFDSITCKLFKLYFSKYVCDSVSVSVCYAYLQKYIESILYKIMTDMQKRIHTLMELRLKFKKSGFCMFIFKVVIMTYKLQFNKPFTNLKYRTKLTKAFQMFFDGVLFVGMLEFIT